MLEQLKNTELSQILSAYPIGLALSDDKKNITWVNDKFQNYLGISAEEVIGRNIADLPEILKQLFNSSEAVHIPANSIRDDQWFNCEQAKLNNTTVHYITDVGQIQLLMHECDSLKAELREVLAIDEVTGMPNKLAMYKSLEPQISRSRRYNNLLSIIIMRINNLEQLNQTQTSNVLLTVSQLLNDKVRWADIVGKLNDSDFLLVLPETTAEACNNLIGNLNDRLDALALPDSLLKDFSVSASFGYAEWAKGDDLNLLMNKARSMLEA